MSFFGRRGGTTHTATDKQKRHRRLKRLWWPALIGTLGLGTVLGTLPSTEPTDAEAAGDYNIYYDGLASGWRNWSWGSDVDLNSTTSVYSGSKSIWWNPNQAWAGLYLDTPDPVQTSSSSTLQFALRASESDQRLTLVIFGDGDVVISKKWLSELGGDPPANSWKYYNIALSNMNAAGKKFSGVALQDAEGRDQAAIRVDAIKLTNTGTTSTAPSGSTGTSGGGCGSVPAYPEVRPNNKTANYTRGRPADPNKARFDGFRSYYLQINGDCVGTTEQILEWAAIKWGFHNLGYKDIAKAMAVSESWWDQNFCGDNGQSCSLLQVKWTVWPDSTLARYSTAYGADYAMAVLRHHFDGASWLGNGTKGNLRNSVAAWRCGCGYSGGDWYANEVFNHYNNKRWRSNF